MFALPFCCHIFHPFLQLIFQITPVFEKDNKSQKLYFFAIMVNKTGWQYGYGFRGLESRTVQKM
jgi:hypothetical protein